GPIAVQLPWSRGVGCPGAARRRGCTVHLNGGSAGGTRDRETGESGLPGRLPRRPAISRAASPGGTRRVRRVAPDNLSAPPLARPPPPARLSELRWIGCSSEFGLLPGTMRPTRAHRLAVRPPPARPPPGGRRG